VVDIAFGKFYSLFCNTSLCLQTNVSFGTSITERICSVLKCHVSGSVWVLTVACFACLET
jgi:hypothetical protein